MEKPYQSKMDDYFSEEYRMKKRLEQEICLREKMGREAKAFTGASLGAYLLSGFLELGRIGLEKYNQPTVNALKTGSLIMSTSFQMFAAVMAVPAIYYITKYFRLKNGLKKN